MTQEEKIRELQERAREILEHYERWWDPDDLVDALELLEDLCSL
jgi:hypothetical protein